MVRGRLEGSEAQVRDASTRWLETGTGPVPSKAVVVTGNESGPVFTPRQALGLTRRP